MSKDFLISNFRRVLNVVCFLLRNSPASKFYMPTFRNILFHLHRRIGTYPPMKMEQSVPKRRNIKFRRRGITQKKAYIMSKDHSWNGTDTDKTESFEEKDISLPLCSPRHWSKDLASNTALRSDRNHMNHGTISTQSNGLFHLNTTPIRQFSGYMFRFTQNHLQVNVNYRKVHSVCTYSMGFHKRKKGKVHPCTGTEALYRPYGP
jgi:hypothetical protein